MIKVKSTSVLNILNASVKPGNTFLKIKTCTEPKMNKKSRITGDANPYLDVRCHSELTIALGFDYESAVNRQRVKELMEENDISKEEAETLNEHFYSAGLWKGKGQHVNRYTVMHTETGQYYLIYRPNQKISEKFINSLGIEIDPVVLEEFSAPKVKNQSQGTEKEIPVRTLKLESVSGFTINGVEYVVEG